MFHLVVPLFNYLGIFALDIGGLILLLLWLLVLSYYSSSSSSPFMNRSHSLLTSFVNTSPWNSIPFGHWFSSSQSQQVIIIMPSLNSNDSMKIFPCLLLHSSLLHIYGKCTPFQEHPLGSSRVHHNNGSVGSNRWMFSCTIGNCNLIALMV